MPHHLPLKAALKRGALIAAANWPLVVVQFIAEATLKLLLAVPVIGGLFLVVLLLGAEVDDLLAGDVRDIVASVFAALRANPVAFAAFAHGVSARAARRLGAHLHRQGRHDGAAGRRGSEQPGRSSVRRCGSTPCGAPSRVHIDPFLDGCKRLWRRYLRLGGCLLIAYAVTAAVYLRLHRRRLRAGARTRRCCSAGRCSRRWRRACSWCGSR